MNVGVVVAVLGAGAVGALLRFAASRFFASRSTFPFAVLVVNVVGSIVAGAALASWTAGGLGDAGRLILVTGFCGGLTTFSTFSVESVQLVLAGKPVRAVVSAALNLVVGIGAAALAWVVTSAILN